MNDSLDCPRQKYTVKQDTAAYQKQTAALCRDTQSDEHQSHRKMFKQTRCTQNEQHNSANKHQHRHQSQHHQYRCQCDCQPKNTSHSSRYQRKDKWKNCKHYQNCHNHSNLGTGYFFF